MRGRTAVGVQGTDFAVRSLAEVEVKDRFKIGSDKELTEIRKMAEFN